MIFNEILFPVPKIVKTAPSPSTESPPINGNGKSKEQKQMESVL
jgi:hypothetical protein